MLLKEKNGVIIHSTFTQKKINKTSNRILMHAQKEILEYFKGHRKNFTIKVNPDGTHFQKRSGGNFYKLNMVLQNIILISLKI